MFRPHGNPYGGAPGHRHRLPVNQEQKLPPFFGQQQSNFPTSFPRLPGDTHNITKFDAEGPHEANLYDMSAKSADVIDLKEAKSYIEEVSRH